jgi:hypothetical protein
MALTAGEGAAKGALGPVATGAEALLSKAGVPGLTPQDQIARAKANPITRYGSEAVGFGASALSGIGEPALVSKLGEGVLRATEAAGVGNKLVQTGIKVGTEVAALQAGDEASKFINQDPTQSLGSAAVNIGLSGIIGGAGGVALGGVSSLWNKAANKMEATKFATDLMGETQFLQDNPDMVGGAARELNGRMSEVENMRDILSDAKPELIATTMPSQTPTPKMVEQAEGVLKSVDSAIEKIKSEPGIYQGGRTQALVDYRNRLAATLQPPVETAGLVPFGGESNMGDAISPLSHLQSSDIFSALNDFKKGLGTLKNWTVFEGEAQKPAASLIGNLYRTVQEGLEDNKAWGAAGDIQKVTNAATTNVINANRDLLKKVASPVMGEKVIDPAKLQTLLNQAEKGKAGLRGNIVRNWLDATQEQADAINKVHLDNDLEAPISSQLNPTPILDHSLNTPPSPGRTLAQWANRKGAGAIAGAAGKTVGGTLGGIAGSLVGHPLAGAWAGEKILAPTFSVLAKPFAEKAVNATAMRSSVDYVANSVKGDAILSNSVKALFGPGETVPKYLIPNAASREKLQKSLEMAENPNHMMQVGGDMGHYLPVHGAAAAAVAQTAVGYLNSIKPKQARTNPFDNVAPVDKFQQAKYERALDVAQQPLMVLKYAKEGTLLPQDVTTVNTIYPGFHNSIVDKVNNELIEQKAQGKQIPYSQRVTLSMLTGYNLDTTLTTGAMQAVMQSAGTQQAQVAANKATRSKGASGKALTAIEKTNSLYATNLEQRQLEKRQA